METILRKMVCFYYVIMFQSAYWIKRFRMRQFKRENPDFAFMFSSEAEQRLNKYIETQDIRIKRLAATVMLKNYASALQLATDEQLSKVELDYLTNLIPEIKNELKII